jgi:hypothetical protein
VLTAAFDVGSVPSYRLRAGHPTAWLGEIAG